MLTEARKKQILQLIEKDGIVQLKQLTDLFGVSIYTIRRDLSDLESKGLIKKTHGGAVRIEKTMWLPTIEEGQKEVIEEKEAIASAAASFVDNGDTIFLMGSTISQMIIPSIRDKKISVVTNSLDIAKSLSYYENIETIIIGGRVKNLKGNVLGSSSVLNVKNYYFDKSFIPCAGVNYKNGVTTSTIDSADFTRAVIDSTRENILIADYRKIGRITFSNICDLAPIKRLITDNKADKNELKEIAKRGVIIHVAQEKNNSFILGGNKK